MIKLALSTTIDGGGLKRYDGYDLYKSLKYKVFEYLTNKDI